MLKPFYKFRNKYRVYIYLFLIIILSFYLRTFNVNWDEGYYFHPDERAIVMFTIPLHLPHNIAELFTPTSPLNPHFFAYGNIPIYLLKLSSLAASYIDPLFKEYSSMYIVGRILSASFDTLTVFIVFLLSSALFSKRAGLISAFLYASCVFSIQTSHFYAVDTMLTFFTTTTILSLIHFIRQPTYSKALTVGILFGMSLAVKISAAVFFIDIMLSIFLLINLDKFKENIKLLKFTFVILISFLLIFFITQPYTLIDFNSFIQQTKLQSQMSSNAYLFPYTLQYVGKIPYIYELKNIIFWGQGFVIAGLNFMGLIVFILKSLTRKKKINASILFVSFAFLSYFLIFGKFAVGWMRYMLPIYPILCLFGGYLISEFLFPKIEKKYFKNYFTRKILLTIFVLITLSYPVAFISIYMHPNTRISASDWINQNIPPNSILAVEHWDDALPVYGGQNYTQLTLPLYDPETDQKWNIINQTISQSQYIIIASNRLYVPLQKLTDCHKLPAERCYPKTSNYYKKLFSGKLGYVKVAEFSSYPTIPFLNLKIVDDKADESFTVYDHPKIYIFKNIDLKTHSI